MLWLFAFLRWGLILANLLLGFSLIYIEHFANYEATYGVIGAVIVLMLWFYLAGLVLLIGSEINVVYDQHQLAANQKTGARPESSHRNSAVR